MTGEREREAQDEKCPTLREPSSLGCNDTYEKKNKLNIFNIHSFQMTEQTNKSNGV